MEVGSNGCDMSWNSPSIYQLFVLVVQILTPKGMGYFIFCLANGFLSIFPFGYDGALSHRLFRNSGPAN